MTNLNDIALFTDFDSAVFDQGLQWVRAAKSLGMPPTVIDHGLADEQLDKLEDLKVRVVDPVVRTGCRSVDAWNAVVEYAKGAVCYCDVSAKPSREFFEAWDGKGMAAAVGEINTYQLLSPVVAIESRVRLSKSLEDGVVAKFGGHLLPTMILGEVRAWRLLAGLSNLLIETGVTDNLPGLRALNFNLYAAYFSGVTVLPEK